MGILKKFFACLAFIVFIMTLRVGKQQMVYSSSDAQSASSLAAPLIEHHETTGEIPQWLGSIFCGMSAQGSTTYNPKVYMPSLVTEPLFFSFGGWILLSLWFAYQTTYNEKKHVENELNYKICLSYWLFFGSLGIVFIFFDANLYFVVAATMILLAIAAWLSYIASTIHSWGWKKTSTVLVALHLFVRMLQ